MQAFELKVAIIERVDQMGRCARRFSAGDRPVIQDNDGPAFLCEQIGGREAGNSRADDAYIGGDVLGEPDREYA